MVFLKIPYNGLGIAEGWIFQLYRTFEKPMMNIAQKFHSCSSAPLLASIYAIKKKVF